MTARHTPGHTPEHVSFVLSEQDHPENPWGVFSGDSLFVGSAGRPDLLGAEESDKLVKELYRTLYDFYLGLDDSVIIFPGHGMGSACGANIGDRPVSTIGYERKFNSFLQFKNVEDFSEFVISGAPPEPTHYKRLKKTNAKGPEIQHRMPLVPALTPDGFQEKLKEGSFQVLDTRSMLAFGGGHVPGALNIGDRSELSVYAGWMLDHEVPILLVLYDDTLLEEITTLLWRTGFTRFAGYLAGGMATWQNSGFPLEKTPQMSVHQLRENLESVQLLDVRTPSEWEEGHLPGAVHCFLPELEGEIKDLQGERPVVTYCGSGYRASIAASLLQSRGFEVRNVPGSFKAWQEAGYPLEKPD